MKIKKVILHSKKRNFGKRCKVSCFTLGTMRATTHPEEMYEMIEAAYNSGINHIETAQSYGNAEKYVGNALDRLEIKKKISKNEWVITTKILPKGDLKDLKSSLLRSLKNLNLTKINNLAIHGINLEEHLDWVLKGQGKKFIQWSIRKGLIDQIGFSSHGSFELINKAIDSDVFQFCNLHLHLFDQSKIPLAQKALRKNMGVLAISPADKGGKLFMPSLTLREASKPFHPLEIAYRFLLSSGITTLSIGANKLNDFDLPIKLANATEKLSNLELNVLANIKHISDSRIGESQCEQCRKCLPCPNEIPIPEILRLRNMYVGLDQIEFAKERYNLIGRAGHWWETKNGDDCNECNVCIQKCPNNLDIPTLLKETHRLLIDKPKRRLWG